MNEWVCGSLKHESSGQLFYAAGICTGIFIWCACMHNCICQICSRDTRNSNSSVEKLLHNWNDHKTSYRHVSTSCKVHEQIIVWLKSLAALQGLWQSMECRGTLIWVRSPFRTSQSNEVWSSWTHSALMAKSPRILPAKPSKKCKSTLVTITVETSLMMKVPIYIIMKKYERKKEVNGALKNMQAVLGVKEHTSYSDSKESWSASMSTKLSWECRRTESSPSTEQSSLRRSCMRGMPASWASSRCFSSLSERRVVISSTSIRQPPSPSNCSRWVWNFLKPQHTTMCPLSSHQSSWASPA